ncbi:MAG: peptidylprolyl isomerase [Polyangiales bacterium]
MKHVSWAMVVLCLAIIGCSRSSSGATDTNAASKSETVVTATETAAAPKPTEATPAEVATTKVAPPSATLPKAPDNYAVKLETTKGDVILDVHRDWAPNGADRFYELVNAGYFNDVAFFRVIDGFMAQVGLHGDPATNAQWRTAAIKDDPVLESNTRGMVSFATAGPNTRTTQFFINFADNSQLNGMGFAPFAKVRDMSVVDKLYKAYGEGAPMGTGPSQASIHQSGNAYLRENFPKLDYIKKATLLN